MRKLILIPTIFLFFCTAVTAQHKKYNDPDSVIVRSDQSSDDNGYTDKPRDTIYIDTTLYYDQLNASADSIAAWKKMGDFSYMRNIDSMLREMQKRMKEKDSDGGSGGKGRSSSSSSSSTTTSSSSSSSSSGPKWLSNLFSSDIFHFFLWTIAILFVLFILYNLFLSDGAFRKKTKSVKTTAPEAEEEVITSESDFEIMIRQAIQSGNYRLAIRYQYLQTLHKLADKNLISLAVDKTNYQYVRELTNAAYQNDFAALTLHYEYVWYGEFAIDESIYRRLEPGFVQFNNKI